MKASVRWVVSLLFICNAGIFAMHTEGRDPVYQVVERMPEFPGGDAEMNAFISRKLMELVVPVQEDDLILIKGRVVATFIVEKDGTVSDIQIVTPKELADVNREDMPPLAKAVMELIESFPVWTPGMQNGNPVRVQYALPIHYRPPR